MNETEGKEGVGTASRVCPPGREIGMESSRSFDLSPSRMTPFIKEGSLLHK